MTIAGAAYLMIVLLFALYLQLLSLFLIVFSFVVVLAALGFIPSYAWPSLQLLGVMVLWIELAQIETYKKSNKVKPGHLGEEFSKEQFVFSREEQLRRITWAGWGIVLGGLFSFVSGYSLVIAVAGAFVANIILAILENNSFSESLRQALFLVEEKPSGSILKGGFCTLLFLSILFHRGM